MVFAYLKRVSVLAIVSFALTAWADDAPVYDVDNFPPSFDGQPLDVGRPDLAAQPSSQSYAHPVTQSLSTEQRFARLEQQINNLLRSGPSSKTEVLQNEVQSLRGQVEELTHQLQQSINQTRAMYADLDKRVTTTNQAQSSVNKVPPTLTENSDLGEATPPADLASAKKPVTKAPGKTKSVLPAAPMGKASNNAQPNLAEEQQIYQTAYDLIKLKKYNEATVALQKMLQKYPSGQFAANAHYWLGELYGLLNKSDQSATEFAMVVKKYPDSPKVSDAQLKLGLIYAGQFKWEPARAAFKKVINNYPGTASARLATEQLKQIKQTGH